MKRFIATLALLVGLTHAAPITMLEVPDATALYDSSDPFAIGVSTAAYTSATNANSKIDAHILRTDNPHGVTAAQAGALTAEADTLATVTARGNITSNTVAAFVTDTALSPFPGLYGSSVYGAGVEGHSISSRGVYGGTVGGYGMTAYAGGGGTGILALASSSGVGLFTPHSIISESTITANIFLGDGSALTDMTVSQIAGAYPASNPSNFVTAAQVSAADIRTPLSTVTTGATSTVTVDTTKRVYYVESAAQTTITNDLSALALNCTSNAEWEVWYNATSTNALAPVWDTRMQFAGGSPDMTCTGVYKFACSSPCGTVIQARQTWPTVDYISRKSIGQKNSVSITGNYHQFMADILAYNETGGFVLAANDNPSSYTYLRVSTQITTTAGYLTNTWLTVGSYAFVANAVTPGTETNMLAKTYTDYKVYVVPPVKSYSPSESYSHHIRILRNDVVPTPCSARITSVYSRKATNNEINHYLAGGRDFR